MKITINFIDKKVSNDTAATAMREIAESIRNGYSSGIGKPEGVLSWRRD